MNTYTLKSLAHARLDKFRNFEELGTYSKLEFVRAFNSLLSEFYNEHGSLIVHEEMTRALGRKTYIVGMDLVNNEIMYKYQY